MTKRVIIGSILGAIVLFAWTAFSWMYCPYHAKTINQFTDEAAVAKVLQDNAPKSGMYLLPHNMDGKEAKTETAVAPAATTDPKAKAVEVKPAAGPVTSPFVFTSVYKPGVTGMTQNLIMEFASSWLAAFLFAILLLFVKTHGFFCRIGFVVVYALGVSVISEAAYWNWWKFSTEFTYLAMADKIIGWTLAGIVMTMIIRRKPACKANCQVHCPKTVDVKDAPKVDNAVPPAI